MNKNNTKTGPNRAKKVAVVAEIAEKVAKAKAMVFTNYTGLTHKQLEGFKREIKKADADYTITKNTLLKLALQNKDKRLVINDKDFQEPTGTMFLYGDVVIPLKALAKMVKDFEKPLIKFGLMDGKLMTGADVLKLSTLPSREVLLSQLAGIMMSPIQGLHRALQWNTQKLVLTLNAVAQKKQSA